MHCPRREVAFAAPPPKLRRGQPVARYGCGRMQTIARDRKEVAFAALPQLNWQRRAVFG